MKQSNWTKVKDMFMRGGKMSTTSGTKSILSGAVMDVTTPGTLTNNDPNSMIYGSPGTYTTTSTTGWGITPEVSSRIHCPLPEDTLEKMLTLGMVNSKGILKDKITAAWTRWCKDQTIDNSVFPILLAFAVMHFAVEPESKETK